MSSLQCYSTILAIFFLDAAHIGLERPLDYQKEERDQGKGWRWRWMCTRVLKNCRL